jgi:hypothetical protein
MKNKIKLFFTLALTLFIAYNSKAQISPTHQSRNPRTGKEIKFPSKTNTQLEQRKKKFYERFSDLKNRKGVYSMYDKQYNNYMPMCDIKKITDKELYTAILKDFGLTNNQIACQTVTPPPPPPIPTAVVNRVENTNGIQYKIYLQEPATNSNRKGIILLGSGNNENDPTTGILTGGLENNICNELAKLGYISAIVAYRDQPPVKPDWSNWNSNNEMLATDMSTTANAIISKYSNGLSRSKVIAGGVSYTSYALLNNIAGSNTLADTKGVLAICGATDTWQAQNFKIPIYSLVCSGNPEGQLNGQTLYNAITNTTVKNNSGYFVDNTCNTHCGGNTNTWTTKVIEQVKKWLP